MKSLFIETASGVIRMAQRDSTAMTEIEFEYLVVKALARSYPGYDCIVFTGTFKHKERGNRPDLALIAKDRSHWFVIEVELTTHSLEGHVLPQIESFVYGEPQDDCASILAEKLNIGLEQAKTLVTLVPRTVAVVADRVNATWEIALRSFTCQMLTLSIFTDGTGGEALQLEGALRSRSRSIAFAQYSAIDKSLKCSRSLNLPLGVVQFIEPDGRPALWTVRVDQNATWISRNEGESLIPHQSHVQIFRDIEGQLHLNVPR